MIMEQSMRCIHDAPILPFNIVNEASSILTVLRAAWMRTVFEGCLDAESKKPVHFANSSELNFAPTLLISVNF